MKKALFLSLIGLILISTSMTFLNSHAAENLNTGTYEYATIRWGGRDNTHIIRPNGQVEFVGAQLKNFTRPDRADDRSLYMNIVLNGLAREGWELSAMTSDDIVVRRLKR